MFSNKQISTPFGKTITGREIVPAGTTYEFIKSLSASQLLRLNLSVLVSANDEVVTLSFFLIVKKMMNGNGYIPMCGFSMAGEGLTTQTAAPYGSRTIDSSAAEGGGEGVPARLHFHNMFFNENNGSAQAGGQQVSFEVHYKNDLFTFGAEIDSTAEADNIVFHAELAEGLPSGQMLVEYNQEITTLSESETESI